MNNPYQQAKFYKSANAMTDLPIDSEVEVAFAGRSNAGKSSALNTLTNQTGLARVSKTPGRTQLINLFSLPQENKFLVDLPGYGYAKVPDNIRIHWEKILADYLSYREALKGIVLIMDSRRPFTSLDKRMLDFCENRGLPAHILLTKADKLTKNELNKQLFQVDQELDQYQLPITVQVYSSLKRTGINELVFQLNQWIGLS